jgi:hypothetical protein
MADAEQDLKIPDENPLADDAQNLIGDETDKLGEGVADAPAPDIVSDAPDAVSDALEKLVEAAPKMAAADGDAATQTPATDASSGPAGAGKPGDDGVPGISGSQGRQRQRSGF